MAVEVDGGGGGGEDTVEPLAIEKRQGGARRRGSTTIERMVDAAVRARGTSEWRRATYPRADATARPVFRSRGVSMGLA